jgi:hypothetical protein
MGIAYNTSIVRDGLVVYFDLNNTSKSWKGAPVINSLYTVVPPYTPFSPWTVGGVNTDVTGTSDQGPVKESKTWKFEKTGTSSQWNGWEGSYIGRFTGVAGDTWGVSYWYKTNSSILSQFSVGLFYTETWDRAYDTTLLESVSNIIPDGQWHYNYSVVQINEDYTNAVIVDGPSWHYSSSAGSVYINGLQWNKNPYVAPHAVGTRASTEGLVDIMGNAVAELSTAGFYYNGDLTFSGDTHVTSTYNNTDLDGDPVFSVEMVVKRTDIFNGGGYWGLAGDASLAGISGYTSVANKISIDLWGTATFHCGIDYPLDEWVHVVWAKNAKLFNVNTVVIYVNGVGYTAEDLTVARGTSHTPDLNTSIKGITMGKLSPVTTGYYAPGEIGLMRIYNRALGLDEVQKNFESIRGRYGI